MRPMRPAAALRLAAVAAVLAGLTAAFSIPAGADEYDDRRARAQDEAAAVGLSVEELDELLEDTSADLVTVYADLEVLSARLPEVQAAATAAQGKVDGLRREAALLGARLEASTSEAARIAQVLEEGTAEADARRRAVGELARDAYRGAVALPALEVLTGAEDLIDLASRAAQQASALRLQTRSARQLQELVAANRSSAARLAAVRTELAALKTEADAKTAEAERAQSDALARMAELESLIRQQQDAAAVLEARRGEQLGRKAQYEAQQAALAAELAAIVEAERADARQRAAAPSPAAAPAAPPPSGGAPAGGPTSLLAYPSPMNPPVITSPYGWRIHPIYGYRKLHAGTDFRAYCGTPIIAAASGTVQWAKGVGGFGNQVLLNHGRPDGRSLMTSYNHLSSFAVRTGDTVSQGQVVGYSGTTGTSTACHLHFEVYVDGATVDPETMLPR